MGKRVIVFQRGIGGEKYPSGERRVVQSKKLKRCAFLFETLVFDVRCRRSFSVTWTVKWASQLVEFDGGREGMHEIRKDGARQNAAMRQIDSSTAGDLSRRKRAETSRSGMKPPGCNGPSLTADHGSDSSGAYFPSTAEFSSDSSDSSVIPRACR